MKLNRTDAFWDRSTRNDINENWDRLEQLSKEIDDLIIGEGGSDSSPEVIQARGGERLLNDRLNKQDYRLQNKADIQYVNVKIAAMATGTPKIVVQSVSDLPDIVTDEKLALVTDNGHLYYYDGNKWVDAGVYQAAGIPDDLVFRASNLMQNGDFTKGVTGWSVYAGGGTYAIANGVMSVTGNGESGLVGIHNAAGYGYQGNAGHKIYMRVRARVTNPDANSIRIYASDGSTIVYLNGEINAVTSPQHNVWYDISGIITLPQTFDGKDVRHFILGGYDSSATANGKTTEIFRPLAINLTQVFGAGNEPSVTDMDKMLSSYTYNWFDGTQELISIKDYVQELNRKVEALQSIKPPDFEKNPYELYDDFTQSTWIPEGPQIVTSKEYRKVLTGLQSLKITVSDSAMTARAVDKKDVNLLLGTENEMMIKLWVDKPSNISAISVYFGNEEDVWGNYCRMNIAGDGEGSAAQSGGLLRPGWNFVAIIPDEMIYTNNFRWSDPVRRMRITVTPKTNDSTSIVVDSIWINGYGTPKLVLTFDDAWKTVYDNAYPIMRKRGIVGTTYVIGQYVDNAANPISPWFCSLNELKELKENGWTLGNHNWQHDYYFKGNHTPKSYVEKTIQNRDWMLSQGIGEDAVHFCYPGGEYDMGVITELKAQGFLSARAAKPRGSHPIEIDDHFQILSRNFHSDVTLEQAKKWVDQCIESGGTTFFQFHQIPIDDTTSEGEENPKIAWSKAKFEGLMDYIVQKGMAKNCLTHAEWYEWAKRSRLLNN